MVAMEVGGAFLFECLDTLDVVFAVINLAAHALDALEHLRREHLSTEQEAELPLQYLYGQRGVFCDSLGDGVS